MSVHTVSAKSVILYHRSYRVVQGSFWLVLAQILLFVIPVSLCSVIFYPEITRTLCQVAQEILTPHYPAESLYIVEEQFLTFIDDFSYLHLPSTSPTPFLCLVNVLVCGVLLLFLPRVEKFKPIMIFLTMITVVHLSSSLFFLFAPESFPYDATEYSRLYILQQISIGFFVPIIMGAAVMALPASLPSRCAMVVLTYLYSLLFGSLRYIVLLYLLEVSSLLYMAVLYFITGPLIDFIYITGIYSVFAARVAKNMKGDARLWKW